MSKPASLSKNIVFNVGGYLVSIIVAFLITPITIHSLGDARYGAWSLVYELIGYYGLLDLGLRGAVTYHVARYSARNQDEDLKQTIASAFWVLLACGAIAFLIGVGLTVAFPYLFQTVGLGLAEIQYALLIMSALIGLSLPMNAFTGGLVGKERFDITSGAEIVNRVLTAVVTYVVLKAGGGLVALALTQAAGRVLYWALTLVACKRIFGGVFVRPAWFKRDRVRDLISFGSRNAVGGIASLVIYRMDLTIVGMFSGISQVTFYTVGSMMISYAWTLCSSITFAFTPRFTHLQSSSAEKELQELFLFAMRVIGMVVTGLVAGILVFGKDFLGLWLGAAYVSGPWTERSDIIMGILIVANLPRMLQSISWQLLLATAQVRFLMWLNVCEAIANLSLSLLLVRYYGPAGVALGTLFPLLVSHVFVMPVYTSRVLKMPLLNLFCKGFAIPLLTGALIGGTGIACKHVAAPNSWDIFFLEVFLTVVLGTVICLALGFSSAERREQLNRMVHKVVV
ncbi:MAG: oligosaccharide flippase family protein [Candidatus Accumulibacter propinquus]|jgi:O-antigen/teichoic acid export membrane protein|uniref:oligosaccharide flippase family protein n=1 Tax=Candidatus Accumulibacter propinquus TaxID=2954380 RepID=UPI002FC3D13A